MRQIIVICTRDRPEELEQALGCVRAVEPTVEVLVADASVPSTQSLVAELVAATTHCVLLPCRPGLARQRNQALAWLRENRPEVEVVHFIDDDTEVTPGYFAEIIRTFQQRPELAGVGGVVVNQARPRHIAMKRVFALYSPRPGLVLPSGRTTIGHYVGDEAGDPAWLPGCAMSYRRAMIDDFDFDDRLEGYSYGEDMYFSFAVHEIHPLAIAPTAQVVHHLSPANRMSKTRLATDKVSLLHRFVRENRHRGMRLSAFWWSVVGDVVLKLADGVIRGDRDSLAESAALTRSALRTLAKPLPTRPPSASSART